MRSPNRRHERESFFKYMSAETARKVLINRSLRWSSPLLFNDPFDVPRELSFGIKPEELLEACRRQMRQLIESPPDDIERLQLKLKLVLTAVKRGISPELREKLLAGIDEVVDSMRPTPTTMAVLREQWRSWLPEHRILCLTESPTHAAMWYHYADGYRGVVLEFRCVDEHDSPWLGARPVAYPLSKPAIYTAEGWAELLCLQVEAAVQAMLEAATFTKAPDWSYEAEWRIASFKRPEETGLFSDYQFHRQDLAAIYFGPMLSAEDRLSLRIAAGAYPLARLCDVTIGMSREFTIRETDA